VEENKEYNFLKILAIGFSVAGIGIAIATSLLILTHK